MPTCDGSAPKAPSSVRNEDIQNQFFKSQQRAPMTASCAPQTTGNRFRKTSRCCQGAGGKQPGCSFAPRDKGSQWGCCCTEGHLQVQEQPQLGEMCSGARQPSPLNANFQAVLSPYHAARLQNQKRRDLMTVSGLQLLFCTSSLQFLPPVDE